MSEESRSLVSISRCAVYEAEEVRRAVQEALEPLGGLQAFVSVRQTVLLKPNLLAPKPPPLAATTHPALVEAIANEVLRLGATPLIGDSPPFRGQVPERYEYLLRVTGMREVADRLGIRTVSLDRPWREIETNGRVFKRLPVAAAFLDADVVINLPKLKTHDLTVFTGAVKNMFGCVPGLRKSQFHLQASEDRRLFAQAIADIFAACRPALSIMDAVVGMQGPGPSHGEAKPIGVILASADAVALDAVACEIVGILPESVEVTRLAGDQGLGEADMERISIVGMDIAEARVPDFRQSPTDGGLMSKVPKPLRGLLRKQILPMPRVLAGRCAACGDCVAVCAAGAMEMAGKSARADLSECIACYCCDEACSHDAIEIRRGRFAELVSGLARRALERAYNAVDRARGAN